MEDEGPCAVTARYVLPLVGFCVQGEAKATIAANSSVNAEKTSAAH
jgi:hypothetical protein